MFYRLKPHYVLRGWQGMAWVLVHRPENQVQVLSQEKFQALLLCDGQTELPGQLLTEPLEKALRQCEAKGWVEASAQPWPLEPDQVYRYYPNRYVMKVFWSITGRCNFRCRHCFMDAPDALLGELSTAEALDFIDQMAACGVLRVDLTGGEPLLRQDFWQLVDRILSHKMILGQIFTNGWLLTEKVLDQLELRGCRPDISISFDGVGWHDWMRGVPGAEESALRAFQLCIHRGYRVHAAMCIHRGSLDALPQTIQTLAAIGVPSVKIANIEQTPLWRCHSEGNDLTYQEYLEAMLPYIDWYYRAGRPIDTLEFTGIARLRRDAPGERVVKSRCTNGDCQNAYLCGAIRWSCYITPEGRLLPCMPMTASPQQNRFPRIQDIGLKKGLSDSYYMQFVNGRIKDLLEANPECAACKYRYQCGGGCRAIALTTGSQELMGCDRQMCIFWKNGYAERIDQAIQKAEGESRIKMSQIDAAN